MNSLEQWPDIQEALDSPVLVIDTATWNRFLEKIDVQKNTCLVWNKSLAQKGYGLFWFNGKYIRAHNFGWMVWKSAELPIGLVPDHLCRNRACVNPTHIEWVTSKINVLRGEGVTAKNAVKTHCPKGHPYDYVYPNGKRGCRVCKKEWARAARHKRSS